MSITINGSSGIVGANGSVTFPALTGADIDTGVFFPEANVVAFSTGSVESFRANANGIFATANVNVTNLNATNLTATNVIPTSSYLRNRIINGDMRIDQRNAGVSTTPTTSAYTLDRWQFQCTQASKMSVQQITSTSNGPVGFPTYTALATVSSFAVGAGDFFAYVQKIEGYNFADFAWGTANAKTVTLSFWVNSTLTGTFGGSVTNSAGNRSYPFTYTISSAGAWEQKTVTIAGDTTGTWVGATNGAGLVLYFGLGSGSTYSGTAGAWAAANYVSATGATSVVGTGSAVLYITGVQLEVGSIATPFERRQFGHEVLLCQRYYQTVSDFLCGGHAVSASSTVYNDFTLPVVMRTTPTAAISGTVTYVNASSYAINAVSTNKCRLSIVSVSNQYFYGFGAALTFAAEL